MFDFRTASQPARRAAVDRLPDHLWIVLHLRIVQGRSVAECAEALMMTEGQVLLAQHRALSVLRDRIARR